MKKRIVQIRTNKNGVSKPPPYGIIKTKKCNETNY